MRGESYAIFKTHEEIQSSSRSLFDGIRDECSRRDSNPGNELGRLRS